MYERWMLICRLIIVASVLTLVRPSTPTIRERYMLREHFYYHSLNILIRLFLFGRLAPSFGPPRISNVGLLPPSPFFFSLFSFHSHSPRSVMHGGRGGLVKKIEWLC